jgi:hypothetical protein
VIEEVRYIRFEPEASSLFFQLVFSRFEPGQLDRYLQQAVRPLGAT